jgi:hypothetical protein
MLTSALQNVRSYSHYRAAKLEQKKHMEEERAAAAAATASASGKPAGAAPAAQTPVKSAYELKLERLGITNASNAAEDDGDKDKADDDDDDDKPFDDDVVVVKKPTATPDKAVSAAGFSSPAQHIPQYMQAVTATPPSVSKPTTVTSPLGSVSEAAKKPKTDVSDIL